MSLYTELVNPGGVLGLQKRQLHLHHVFFFFLQ